MSQLWNRLGPTILAEPRRSLAAFFGDQASIEALSKAGLTVPELAQFAKDKEFDPNPHKLKLPRGYLQTVLLIRSLSIWGSESLIRAAVVCAELQALKQTECNSQLVKIRDAARIAAMRFLASPDAAHRKRARTAANACQRAYKPFENRPDTTNAANTWNHLGAPWFAAETAAQDWSLSKWDGLGPPGASASWRNRNAVWPERAAAAAAHWSSDAEVRSAIQTALLDWSAGEKS